MCILHSPLGRSYLNNMCMCYMFFSGTDRFATDIVMMTGRRVSPPLRVMWMIVIPVFVMVSFEIILILNIKQQICHSDYKKTTHGNNSVLTANASFRKF